MTTEKRQKTILGIGSALTDILTQIDNDSPLCQWSLPKGSMTYVDAAKSIQIGEDLAKRYDRQMAAGGSAANTISGLARMNIKAGFLSKIGDDEIGRFFESEMLNTKVHPIMLKSSTPSGRVQAIVSPDGERTFATCLGASAELCSEDIVPALFEGWDIFYVEGYLVANPSMLDKAIATAKAQGMVIAIDMASYNVVEENRDYLSRLIRDDIDIVFANEMEAKALTGLDPEDALHQMASICNIAVVKVGAKGAYIQQGDEVISIEPIKAQVIDTTGAGDMWAAGFLAGYANGDKLKKCGTMGAILAANVIEVMGAKMEEERWQKIYNAIGKLQ